MSSRHSRSRPGCSADQPTELADRRSPRAGGDPQLVQLLERLEPELLEPVGLAPGELLAGEVAEGRPRPLGEALLEPGQGGRRGAGGERLAGLAEAALEAGGIELVVGHRQPVAGRRRGESIGSGAERMADARDVDLDRLDRAERLVVGPQPVGQELGGDRAIALEHEQREDAPLAGATELERPPVRQHRDVPEKTELELHVGSRAMVAERIRLQSSVKSSGSW